jgi:DNA-binding MarR family transcriptional regulator
MLRRLGSIVDMSSQTGGEDDLLLERQLCFALAVASRTVISAYRPVLQAMDLTHPQYLVMLALWERNPRSVKDLGDALLLSPATLSPLLKRLEATGYVTRRRTEGDERSLAVGLTERGISLREQAMPVPDAMMKMLALTRAEAAELHANMIRLIGAAQARPTEGPGPGRPLAEIS